MIEKIESFVKTLGWECFYFSNEKENPENKLQNLFCSKSSRGSLQNEYLNSFENALYDMMQSIELKTVRTSFKKEMNKIQSAIDDRMECYSDQHVFITLKDYKNSFKNNPSENSLIHQKMNLGILVKKT